MEQIFICRYCGKECKNFNSLRNHERLCKYNPNRQESSFVKFNKLKSEGVINVWNKGLTKETDCRVERNAKSIHNSYITGKTVAWQKGLTKENDIRIKNSAIKISNTCLEKSKNGTWHKSLAKNMHYKYNGVDLDGLWELKYAQYLDLNNIKWERPSDRFEYVFEDKLRYYTPDFYLVDDKIYVEIKGYKTDKDDAKWKQFPPTKKLQILFKQDLLDLNIIDK